MLRREQIERLKERYPAGTVVRLGQMEGEHQMPSGMEGKVIDVDDIGQIHVEWENGSTLALNVEEDDFTVVPQKETLSEKKCREFLGKINEILKETDFYLLNVSCNGGDTAYAAQKLLAMHQAFETVYGEGYVDEEYGMVMMPAVVCGRDSGIRTLALVTLDLESSGEHFGTIFMTPGGLLEQGSSSLSEKQKQALAEYYIPYDYWYTPLVERDHHVDFTQMPEEVCGRDSGIRTLALVTLDLESSGEHFGTIFMTPGGLLEQGSSSLSEKQKQALAEYYIPYDYWYTPLVERDHHVDFTQMPEEVADIRRMVDELLVQGEAFHMNEPK
jgi:hypothetical protein